eukprot:TRINITY_DN4036_c0_g2_i11.p1 TRINITY_DN4036_c0_g2~~TRINITY_DN4036_c0_g2_i11.p1  ORF type:complete len:850 (+),score=160.85 TRINITY_DN4036_c0_g2_i11:337-2886(+)
MERVIQAIEVLHHTEVASKRREADMWLQEFRSSTSAWPMLLEILDKTKDNLETMCPVHFYVFNSLRDKINRQWDTLSPEGRQTVVVKLPSILFVYSHSSPSVTNQLVSVCAAVGVRTLSSTWSNFFSFLFTSASETTDLKFQNCLIKVFASVVEELQSPMVGPQCRAEVKDRCLEVSEKVLSLLVHVIQKSDDGKILPACLTCIEQWVRLGISLRVLMKNNTFEFLWYFMNPNEISFFSICIRIFQTIVRMNGTDTHNPKNQEGMYNPDISSCVLSKILSLHPLYQEAVQRNAQDVYLGIVNLVSEFAEYNRAIISRGKSVPMVAKFLDFFLDCTINPQKNVAEICFPVWYLLLRTLKDEDVCVRLFNIILNGATYHVDFDGNDEDEIGMVQSYRKQSSPVIRSIFSLLSASSFFRLLSSVKPSSWPMFDSMFFCLKVVAQLLDKSMENSQQVMNYLQMTLPGHPVLFATYFSLLDMYSSCFQELPQKLPQVIQITLHGIGSNNKKIQHEASKALSSICTDCSRHLVGEIIEIIIGFNELKEIEDADKASIIKGLISVIFELPTPKEIIGALVRLLTPVIHELHELAMSSATLEEARRTKTLKALKKLRSGIKVRSKKVFEEHPVVLLLASIWSVLKKLETIWTREFDADLEVVKSVYKTYMVVLNMTGTASKVLLPHMIENLLDTLETCKAHVCLCVVRDIIVIFSEEEIYFSLLRDMMKAVSQIMLSFSNNPETIGDLPTLFGTFFDIVFQTLKHNSKILTERGYTGGETMAEESVCIAIRCIGALTSVESIRSLSIYLAELLCNDELEQMMYWKNLVPAILSSCGNHLISSLLKVLSYHIGVFERW